MGGGVEGGGGGDTHWKSNPNRSLQSDRMRMNRPCTRLLARSALRSAASAAAACSPAPSAACADARIFITLRDLLRSVSARFGIGSAKRFTVDRAVQPAVTGRSRTRSGIL